MSDVETAPSARPEVATAWSGWTRQVIGGLAHVTRTRFEHVGITVADLDTVTAFFVGLGLEVEGGTFVEGEFLNTVSGIPNARTEIVMLWPPDGSTRLELSSFIRPRPRPGVAGRDGQ